MSATPFPLISGLYRFYLAIGVVLVSLSIGALLIWGVHPSLDFTGGTEVLFAINGETEMSKESLQQVIPDTPIQSLRRDPQGLYELKLAPLSDTARSALTASLSATLQDYEERSLTTVGPIVGQELVIKTLVGLGCSFSLILLYLALRFRSLEFGVCAVAATMHDGIVLLGVFSFLGKFYGVQIDTLFVTALLTVVSFSVHDTVVVYDRIRERKKTILREHMRETIDSAAAETLIRSLRNAGAIIIVLLALFLLGGETLRWFAFALLIGTISGTYSSTFVALPLLVLWEKRKSH